jgi:pimeloyl-ACP methyl ester carboxylesterase
LDRLTLAVQATEHALARVVEACSANPACAAAYPDIVSDWETGLRGLDAAPSLIRDEGLAVEVDAATAVRYLRNVFRQPGRVPLAVRDLALHGWTNEGPAGSSVSWTGDPLYWAGYGMVEPGLAHGSLFSTLCHDELPFVDAAALDGAVAGRPWYAGAYAASVLPAVCQRWDVGRSELDRVEPFVSDIPTLFLVGRFDPYSPLPLVRNEAGSLARSFVVEFPDQSHNVLASDCAIAVRNSWIDAPTSPPDTACTEGVEWVDFALPPPDAVR